MQTVREEILAWFDQPAPTTPLAASEQRLNLVLDIVPVSIVYLDSDLRILFANRLYLRRSGKEAGEVVGQSIRTVLGPDNFQRIEPYVARVLRGEHVSYHVKVRYPRLGERDLRVLYAPHREDNGTVSGFVAAIEDITERREIEERFQTFAEFSPDGLWFADAATMTIEYLSPALDLMWGVDRRAILGSFDRWLELRHPEDRAAARDYLDRLRAGESRIAEHRIVRHNDGAVRWIRDYGFPIRGADGGVRRIAGISRDITDDKAAADRLAASEERLRLIIENAREFAIFTLDLERRVTTWNTGAQRVLGFHEREILGQSGDVIFTPEDLAVGAPAIEAEMALRDGHAADERWHVRKDGQRLWGSGFMMPMHGTHGTVIGFVKILHDRTDAKQAEEALQRERSRELAESARKDLLQKLASAQEDERRRISRELHDEVGQHITALLLGLNEAAGRTRDAAEAARLRELQALAELLGKEVHRVAVQLRPTSLDDLGLVRSLRTLIEMWSERAAVRADFHTTGFCSDRLPPTLETTIYRIVQESLNNVLKHAQATTVAVILECKPHEVSALIEDDGRGFDVNEIERTGSERRLGLLGMNERALMAGGELRIESQPGQGTTVIARFPLSAEGGTKHD